MADQFKVAPLSPTAGAETSSPEAAQYMEALNQSMQALERRMTPQTNLFNIAAGFLKPTRGGGFGESLGNASEVMGKEQSRISEEALPIAQMRAQLAGQRYEMAQRDKAMQSLNAMVNTPQVITETDLPAISKATGIALDDGRLKEFVGQPRSVFMTSTGDSVVGVNAQPAINKADLNQALIASGGDPRGAMKLLFERNTKWGEPSQLQKDLKYAIDASTPPEVRKIVLDKLTSDAQRLGFDIFKFAAESGVQIPGGPRAGGAPQPSASGKPSAPFSGEIVPPAELATQLQRDFGLKPDQLSLDRTRAQQQGLYERRGQPGVYTPVNPADHPGREKFHENAIDVPTSVPASYMEARGYYRPDPKNDPVHWVPREKATDAQAGTTTAQPPAGAEAPASTGEFKYPDGTAIEIPASVPPAKRYEYAENRMKEYQQNVEKAEASTGKIYEKKMETIATIDPSVLTKQNMDFVEAKRIINNPELKPYLAKMFQQGLVPGAMTALNNGIKVGPWSASVDAYDIWLRSLPAEVQAEVKRLDQIMGTAYMAAVSAKPFGAAPSNFEDLQMKNTMATARDPYKIINNFLNEQTIANTHLIDMRNRFDEFNANKPKTAQPYGFFGTNSYKESIKTYNEDYKAYKALGAK